MESASEQDSSANDLQSVQQSVCKEPKIVKKGDCAVKEYVHEQTGKINVYEPGIKLEVSDFKGVWYPAKVLEVDQDENEVLVHYDKWSTRFDEWIKCDSNRLRPTSNTKVVQIEFKAGEKVEAVWSTDGNRYPGVIQTVLSNDYYEILFEDGIKCKKKASQIFKIQRGPRRASSTLQKSGKVFSKIDNVESKVDGAGASQPATTTVSITSISEKSSSGIVSSTGLGKRKRVSHDYSLFLKTPKLWKKPVVVKEPSEPSCSVPIVPTPEIDSISTDLGKRKRASHDYSLFLKVPRAPKKLRVEESPETSSAADSKQEQVKNQREKEIKLIYDESAQEQQQQDESLLPARKIGEPDSGGGALVMPASRKCRRGRKLGRRPSTQFKTWSGRGRPPRYSLESSSRADVLTGYHRLQLKYIERKLYKNGQHRKLHFIPKPEVVYVDIINCECGKGEEFELMMQCELCQSWQHGPCYGIQEVTQMPQYYVCNFCRDPKRFRHAFRDEWSQEINKTGQLPRLSIAPRVSSVTEKKMKTCNDLMRRLDVVRDCLRSTQIKIELFNTPAENPKLYRWHREATAPWEDVRQYQFNRHFRGLIRRLLRQHRNDPEYVKQFRTRIENRHKPKEVQWTRSDEDHIQGLIKKRLNTRAWQMLNDMKEKEQIEEVKNNDNLNMMPQDDLTVTDESTSVSSHVVSGFDFDSDTINQFDSVSSDDLVSLNSISLNSIKNGLLLNNGSAGGDWTNIGLVSSACGNSEEPGTSKQAMEEEAIKKFKLELRTKMIAEHLPLFEAKNDNLNNVTHGKKYLLLAKETGCGEMVGDVVPVSQKFQSSDGQIMKKVVGTGTIVAKISGLHVIRIIENDHPIDKNVKAASSSIMAVNAEHLGQLKLCRPCKNNFKIKWNSKDFVREENVTLTEDGSQSDDGDEISSSLLLTSESQSATSMNTNTTSSELDSDGLLLHKDPSEAEILPTFGESAQVSQPSENPEVQFKSANLTSDEDDEDSTTLLSNSFGQSMPERITAESCRAHLHADIVKQQAMLDFQLDMLEEKLKSLESSSSSNKETTDPNYIIRKLKDLEELKRKVERVISDNSFLTKIETLKETEVQRA